jgi:ATP-dependent DNA helicase RecG
MRETNTLEFKQNISSTFLKTVSAFANYNGGTILFGVDDGGAPVGLDDPTSICLAIENKINDTIAPQPDFTLEVEAATRTVRLTVKPGRVKPYLYKSKAYRRNSAATIEVDSLELARLVLAGRNVNFEQLTAGTQALTFAHLGAALKEHAGLKSFGADTLKTLNLLSPEGEYNNAAALLADKNDFPGVNIAVFGANANEIRRRVDIDGTSALAALDGAVQVYEDQFCYEAVANLHRQAVERIPRAAFRGAVANAIVHRAWDVSAPVTIAMFDDRAVVTSPGGLPDGLTEEAYLQDMISVRRNPILANVFYRLGIIEAFGTGVARIKAAYAESVTRPTFEVGASTITVTLPVLKQNVGLSDDLQTVYDLLSPAILMSSGQLIERVPFGRSKLTSILNELVESGFVTAQGAGRGRKYKRAN